MQDRDELKAQRLTICKECPLYKEGANGPVCNSSKYISKDGKDWSWLRKDGYIRGCGCALKHKTGNPNSHCIINKW